MDKNNNTVNLNWDDLNDETFKPIEGNFDEVLGLNNKGGLAAGQIVIFNNEGFIMKTCLGSMSSKI